VKNKLNGSARMRQLSNKIRLRDELNRSNEQIEEYRQMICLLNEKNLTTNIDDLNGIEYFDDDDDSRPIEKKFLS